MDKENKQFVKSFEESLKLEKNQKYIDNWNKFTKKFGKKLLLDLFNNAKDYMNKNSANFKFSFGNQIINKLKEKRKQPYIEREIYINLMSIFSKYLNFSKKYEKSIFENLNYNIAQGSKNLQNNTKEDIKDAFYVPREEQIREDEKDILSMNKYGDILPPNSSNKDFEQTQNYEKRKTSSSNNKDNKDNKDTKQTGINSQIEINFDNNNGKQLEFDF